jgi:hypothetical protein
MSKSFNKLKPDGKKKGSPGRPKLPEKQLRNMPITVEFSQNEIEELTRRCAATNTRRRTFIRNATFGYPLPRLIPELNREAWLRLVPLAGALTRVVTMINAGRDVGISPELAAHLRDELAGLRRELRGGGSEREKD